MMENNEKLESGKYISVLKIKSQFKTVIAAVSFLFAIATAYTTWIRKSDLTFDNQEQKQKVINDSHPLTEMEAMKSVEHMYNKDVHLSVDDRVELQTIRNNQADIMNNQVKIGQDLQQIKQSIK